MSKKILKALSVILCMAIMASVGVSAVAQENAEEAKSITINNPYEDVIWEGENAWTGYKGSLHTHSTYSDAKVSLREIVMEYYNQGYGFLGMADHAVTGVEWDKAPATVATYLYQYILGYPVEHLTTEEYEQILAGTYPMADGSVRDFGLTCVTGANELNSLTLTKCHVVAYNLPSDVGNGHGGVENGQLEAVQFAAENGGYSVIAHPGDWLESNKNIAVVYNQDNIDYYAEILLENPTCLGMEVFNENNNTTPYDRNLWDNVLMKTLPYGRNVIAYGNSDAHELKNVDSSFSTYFMPDNSQASVEEAMHNGNFFITTRKVHANQVLGPEKTIDVINQRLSVPMATKLDVDGTTLTMDVENANLVQWVANGKVIAKTAVDGTGTSSIDITDFEGYEDFLYVRAEIFGEGGCTCSQAFVIDNGTELLQYEKDTSFAALLEKIWHKFTSMRIYVIIQEIARKF